MYCPRCGKPDQTPESYCRQCGVYLPDPFKPAKKTATPAEHVQANLVLNALTVITCFVLAGLVYGFLAFRDDTHILIYVTAGFLVAMGCWHTQTLWRSILLRRHFRKQERAEGSVSVQIDGTVQTDRVLQPADMSDLVQASVTERTTRDLAATGTRSTKTQKEPN